MHRIRHRRPISISSIAAITASVLLLAVAHPLPAQLIVSELYRDPTGAETALGGGKSHEFVEIANLGPDSLALDSLFISNGLEADSIVPVRDTLLGHGLCLYGSRAIAPGAVALILDPDYRSAIAEDTSRRFSLPAGTVLLQCGDGEFGSGGLAADHGVIVYRGMKSRIDTILCSAVDPGTVPGEPAGGKITLSEPVNREGLSLVAAAVLSDRPVFDYGDGILSPGRLEPLRDGWLVESRLSAFDRTAGSVGCSVLVQCASHHFEGALPWRLETLRDGKRRTVQTGTIACSGSRGGADLRITVDSLELRFVLLVDENPSWGIDLSAVWLPALSLRITEIFPKASAGTPEWFEISNTSAMPVSLRNWRFGNGEDTAALTETGFRLEPGAYAVVTKDAAAFSTAFPGVRGVIAPPVWHTLDNTRDTLMLFDATGVPRETICYDARWFDSWPYVPLERNGGDDGCSPSSWCVAARATPGQPNAALYWRNTTVPSLDIGPVPFTPDNDGVGDKLAIRLALTAAATVAIDIYGFDGRVVKRFSGMPQEVYYWDGRGNGGDAPPGPFFVVAEIKQGNKMQRIRKKGILWRK
ncbi:MAG: lamin tail domain-containing protein [Chitinispirillaceae bacterium]|nr:lamin tail domain-containing protein [Chitinispirillaceae bacterium]